MFKRLDTKSAKMRIQDSTPATPATPGTQPSETRTESRESREGSNSKLHFSEGDCPSPQSMEPVVPVEPQKTDNPAQISRRKTNQQLFELYNVLGQHYGNAECQSLKELPGWNEQRLQLEEAYDTVWKAGGDPENEFEALKGHWREGVRAIKNAAATGGEQ